MLLKLPTLARAGALVLLALIVSVAEPARAQQQEQPQPQPAPTPREGALGRPSFDIVVRAPNGARELLERNLELRRYREVPDLDEVELQRLLVLAERDARRLLATRGWFDPALSLRIEQNGGTPRVVIDVQPGTTASVASVDLAFEGDLRSNDDATARAQRGRITSQWSLPAGRPFTQEAWDDAKAGALRELTARRYLRGRIEDSMADVDARTGKVGLGLKLDSGPVFRLGAMSVTGMQRYDPRLVPRLARLAPGSEYDRDRIVQAQLRLAGSGYFDSAFIAVDPEGDPAAAPVQVNVREAPLQKLQFGVGVSTDTGPRLRIEHRHNKLPLIGWRADTRLQIDAVNPLLQTELTSIPDAQGWRWAALASVEQVKDRTQTTVTQRLRGGRTYAGESIDRNYYLQFDRSFVRDVAPGVQPADTGDGSAISANTIWTGRYFDNRLAPTAGSAVGFEFGGGITLEGSRSPFQRSVLRGVHYVPLSSGRVQLRGEAGAVLARRSARVPYAQLFLTGGDTTVRGYGFRDIGVTRNGTVGPGRYEAVASAEWQRPLRFRDIRNLEHTLFVDAGAVADRVGDLRPSVGIGTGVRFVSPIGPLQADIAYGVKTRRLRLHLTVGVVF